MTRLIAVMPVKNEAWILPKTLRALGMFCDAIIVADQGSTDETPEILRSVAKVHVIQNPKRFHNNAVRWQLLDAAREFDGNNLIITLDADEVVAATILEPDAHTRLREMKPGQSICLPWLHLWRNPVKYRNDHSVWSGSTKHVLFRDDRQGYYDTTLVPNDHCSRIPESYLTDSCQLPIPILHYQFVIFSRMLAKQRWYRLTELLNGVRAGTVNQRYIITKDERNMRLSPVPDAWLDGWRAAGIDLDSFPDADLYWYDVEVLRYFAHYDPTYFSEVDIWDVDWEQKRQLAISHGYDGLPLRPIIDPRNAEQKLYHRHLHRHIDTPLWRDPLKPLRDTAIRLGLKRAHLERLGVLRPHRKDTD